MAFSTLIFLILASAGWKGVALNLELGCILLSAGICNSVHSSGLFQVTGLWGENRMALLDTVNRQGTVPYHVAMSLVRWNKRRFLQPNGYETSLYLKV